VQEYSTPLAVEIDEAAALPDAVQAHATNRPSSVVFRRKSGSGWQDVTAKEFADEVAAVAKGLVASGVQAGDRVGLMSKTRYEWTLCD
jgi:long-chain acyl-CoA synthetase